MSASDSAAPSVPLTIPVGREPGVDPAPGTDLAIEQALRRLATGGDVELLLGTVRSMVQAGVPGLAVRLLRSTGPLLSQQAELASLVTPLAGLPSGELPRPLLLSRFRDNAAVVSDAHPHLRDLVETLPALGRDVHVFVTGEGNTQVVRDHPLDRLSFVLPFGDHRRRAEASDLGGDTDDRVFLLVGVPPVPLLERLLALRGRTGYAPPVEIIEPDPEIFALWLHLFDGRALLGCERIGLFAGPRSLAQYEQVRTAELWRSDPTHRIRNARPDWVPPGIDDVLERVRVGRATRRRTLVEQQHRLYDAMDAAAWARRFRRAGREEPPLRVLAFSTRFSTVIQYALRDLGAAFARRGCSFELVMERSDCTSVVDSWSVLAERPVDLVLVINHLRMELGDRVHPRLPYVCWIQDHMPRLWTEEAGRSISGFDLVVGAGRGLLTSRYGYPAERFLATSNLTDLTTYAAEPVPTADADAHRCDVSYVSHGSASVESLIDEIAARSGPPLQRYLSRVVELMRRRLAERGWVPLVDRLEIMLAAEADGADVTFTPVERNTMLEPAVSRLFDRIIRHETLEWVAEWAESRSRSFRLYGRGWSEHPRLGRFACGEIANGYPLRCVYQASSVNLQINGYASLHQRLLDALAAGGFVLTRYNPADFLRQQMVRVGALVRREGLDGLEAVRQRAASLPELAEAIGELERLGHPTLAPIDEPRRQRQRAVFRETQDLPDEALTDAAYFDTLMSLRHAPHRAAADLPGFEQTTFDTRDQLHDLLDRVVDDAGMRRRLAEPMHRSVAEHDTTDGLAARIIEAFRSPPVGETTS